MCHAVHIPRVSTEETGYDEHFQRSHQQVSEHKRHQTASVTLAFPSSSLVMPTLCDMAVQITIQSLVGYEHMHSS